MSYNGIGLQSARGSGTSGHVQTNLAKQDSAPKRRKVKQAPVIDRTQHGGDIRDHDRKRYISVKCMELRDELEDQDVDDVVIEQRVSELKSKLEQSSGERVETGMKSSQDIKEAKLSDEGNKTKSSEEDNESRPSDEDNEVEGLSRKEVQPHKEVSREVNDKHQLQSPESKLTQDTNEEKGAVSLSESDTTKASLGRQTYNLGPVSIEEPRRTPDLKRTSKVESSKENTKESDNYSRSQPSPKVPDNSSYSYVPRYQSRN